MTYSYLCGGDLLDVDISMPKGQLIAGNAIGILVMNDRYPYLPGLDS